MEEERSRLQEVIGRMEARLSEQSRLLEQVSILHPEHQGAHLLGLGTSLCSVSFPFPSWPPIPTSARPSPMATSPSAQPLEPVLTTGACDTGKDVDLPAELTCKRKLQSLKNACPLVCARL